MPGTALSALAEDAETKARSDDGILDGARYEDLARLGVGPDTSRDMSADPAEVIADRLAFPGVHQDSQLAPQCLCSGASQRHPSADCARGAIKGREHTVARSTSRRGLDSVSAHNAVRSVEGYVIVNR